MRDLSRTNHLRVGFVVVLAVGLGQVYASQADVNQKSENLAVNSTKERQSSTELLRQYIDIAISNNAGLKASFESYRAQKQKVRPAGTLPDPKFTYANFIRSVETRVGPQEHKFGIQQAFPWFGTLSLQSKIAKDGAQSVLHQFENQRLSLIRKVKHTFYEAYFLDRSITILEQNLDLIANLERVTRSRYRTGVGQFSDVIRSQVELEKLKDQLKTMTDLRTPLTAKFNALLNRTPDETISWPKAIPRLTEEVNARQIRQTIEEQNPQLKSLDVITKREQKKIRLAKKDGLPSFKLGFDYIMTGEAQAPVADSGKDPMAAMIALDIPLWRGKYNDQVKEAKSKELSARKMREEKLNQLYAALSQSIYEYSNAIRKIELYRANLIPKGRQSFEATKRGYEAGKASFSDLIDSERLLLEFQLAHEEALTKANKAQASIDMLIGKSDPAQQEKK